MPRRKRSERFLTCRACGKTPAERGDHVSERAVDYLCCRCLTNPVNIAADCQSEEHGARIKQVVGHDATGCGSARTTAISSEHRGRHGHPRRRAAPGALEALPRARAARASQEGGEACGGGSCHGLSVGPRPPSSACVLASIAGVPAFGRGPESTFTHLPKRAPSPSLSSITVRS